MQGGGRDLQIGAADWNSPVLEPCRNAGAPARAWQGEIQHVKIRKCLFNEFGTLALARVRICPFDADKQLCRRDC